MRGFGYLRVSSVAQVEGVSLDAQRAKITAYCLANDVELADVFVDAGLSGGRADNRPGLQACLDAVCKSKGNVLVAYSLSRIARSTKDTLLIAERLQRADANLVSLSEKIDTTSAAGKMVFRLLSVLNEFERDLASDRTRMAAAYKRSRGEAWAVTPYGMTLGDDGKQLVIDQAEQHAIDTVVGLRAEGHTLKEIVEEMNARGIPRRNGGRWHLSTVHDLLKRQSRGVVVVAG